MFKFEILIQEKFDTFKNHKKLKSTKPLKSNTLFIHFTSFPEHMLLFDQITLNIDLKKKCQEILD
jgi:hypothetical protein